MKKNECETLYYFNLKLWRPITKSKLNHVAIATTQMNAIDLTTRDFPGWVIVQMSPAYLEYKQ